MSFVLIGSIAGILVLVVGIILYPALKVAPYAYSSARIRSAKGKLLSNEELHVMAKGSYKDALLLLEKKGYPEILNLIEEDFREDVVHKSLRLQSAKEVRRLIDYVPKQHRPFFIQLYRKDEVMFILAMLRSKKSEFSDRYQIGSLIHPTKYFTEDDMQRFQNMTLDEFLSKLERTRYRAIITKHRSSILAGDLFSFENEFLQEYYTSLHKKAQSDPTLSNYTSLLIDLHNTRFALCFGNPQYVSGGKIDPAKFAHVKTIDDVKDVVKDTPFGSYVQDSTTVQDMVKALLRYRKEYAISLARKSSLDISLLLAYSVQKTIELKNIRLILKLINSRFSPEEIRRAII